MKTLRIILMALAPLALPLAAQADPGKDESGHGKGRGHDRREYRDDHGHGKAHKHGPREYKEEYTDGNCKVKRKLEKNGEYKEERKCKGPAYGRYEQAPVYVPGPPPVYQEPGVTIRIR